MNSLELRYEIYKFLSSRTSDDVRWVALDSPKPGQPVALTVASDDSHTMDVIRTYRITVEEI